MQLQDKLQELRKTGRAILATNFYNFETLSGILSAACEKKEPIILQLSESSIKYLGLDIAMAMARAAIAAYGVEAWIHLDHGSSVETARRCLDAGFDSVMIDASDKPFSENVDTTAQVVAIAKSYGANVEGELGYVAKLGQQQVTGQYTSPEQAAKFVEQTGVHALAVAVGSAHGFYKEVPNLQFDLLASIRKATPAALVLHGASGIPDDQLRRAISAGISKVNLATETKNVFMKRLQQILADTDEIDLRKVFPEATRSVTNLILAKIELLRTMLSEPNHVV